MRPTGVLGFISGAGMIRVIFVGMALALGIGGASAVFRGNLFRNSQGNDFILPDDNPVATVVATPEISVTQYAVPPPFTIDPALNYEATIRTEMGDIVVKLLPDEAPETVNNFVFLAEDGFYDGLAFHFVAPGFSATAGDPACTKETSTSSRVCNGGPGYGIDINEDAQGEVTTGTLAMVNGSQFFIALEDSSQFNGYAPFGKIVSGLDVAETLMANTEIQSIDISVE